MFFLFYFIFYTTIITVIESALISRLKTNYNYNKENVMALPHEYEYNLGDVEASARSESVPNVTARYHSYNKNNSSYKKLKLPLKKHNKKPGKREKFVPIDLKRIESHKPYIVLEITPTRTTYKQISANDSQVTGPTPTIVQVIFSQNRTWKPYFNNVSKHISNYTLPASASKHKQEHRLESIKNVNALDIVKPHRFTRYLDLNWDFITSKNFLSLDPATTLKTSKEVTTTTPNSKTKFIKVLFITRDYNSINSRSKACQYDMTKKVQSNVKYKLSSPSSQKRAGEISSKRNYRKSKTSIRNENTLSHRLNSSAKTNKTHVPKKLVNQPVKCFTCGLNEKNFGTTLCDQAFKESRLAQVKIRMRTTCQDAYKGGCFKRFTDIGSLYVERGCRSWFPARGQSYASRRLAKLEFMLRTRKSGCTVSPQATITPFSRAVSLFARFHVCVCQVSEDYNLDESVFVEVTASSQSVPNASEEYVRSNSSYKKLKLPHTLFYTKTGKNSKLVPIEPRNAESNKTVMVLENTESTERTYYYAYTAAEGFVSQKRSWKPYFHRISKFSPPLPVSQKYRTESTEIQDVLNVNEHSTGSFEDHRFLLKDLYTSTPKASSAVTNFSLDSKTKMLKLILITKYPNSVIIRRQYSSGNIFTEDYINPSPNTVTRTSEGQRSLPPVRPSEVYRESPPRPKEFDLSFSRTPDVLISALRSSEVHTKSRFHTRKSNGSRINVGTSKCYTCGLDEEKFGSTVCHEAFRNAEFVQKKVLMRTLCERAFKKGCFKRFIDLGPLYVERGCRRWFPIRGKSYASRRLVAIEYMLKTYKSGCMFSPSASLTPFSKSVSLYARYHVCVCQGNYCNLSSIGRLNMYLKVIPLLLAPHSLIL